MPSSSLVETFRTSKKIPRSVVVEAVLDLIRVGEETFGPRHRFTDGDTRGPRWPGRSCVTTWRAHGAPERALSPGRANGRHATGGRSARELQSPDRSSCDSVRRVTSRGRVSTMRCTAPAIVLWVRFSGFPRCDLAWDRSGLQREDHANASPRGRSGDHLLRRGCVGCRQDPADACDDTGGDHHTTERVQLGRLAGSFIDPLATLRYRILVE